MRELRPVGSAWRTAPTSLYRPRRRDSLALSIILARFTSIKVSVSDLISSKGFFFLWVANLLGVFLDEEAEEEEEDGEREREELS